MKKSSADLPLWREGCEQQRPPRLYNLHSGSQTAADAARESQFAMPPPEVALDGHGKLAELIARHAPPESVAVELIRSLCRATGAACGVSFMEQGRRRIVAGPERFTHFWRAYSGTTAPAEFDQARHSGKFANPCPIGILGQIASAGELQMLAEAVGFRRYFALPLRIGPGSGGPGLLELFCEQPEQLSLQQIAEVQSAARIAQLAFANRV